MYVFILVFNNLVDFLVMSDASLCMYSGKGVNYLSIILYYGVRVVICAVLVLLQIGNEYLKSVVLPTSLVVISDYALYNCRGLQTAIIPT